MPPDSGLSASRRASRSVECATRPRHSRSSRRVGSMDTVGLSGGDACVTRLPHPARAGRTGSRSGSADAELAHDAQALDRLVDLLGPVGVLGVAEDLLLQHGDVLHVGVLEHAGVTVTATDARGLEASGRALLAGVGAGEAVVDVDVAGLDPAPDRLRVGEVGTPDAGIEAVLG